MQQQCSYCPSDEIKPEGDAVVWICRRPSRFYDWLGNGGARSYPLTQKCIYIHNDEFLGMIDIHGLGIEGVFSIPSFLLCPIAYVEDGSVDSP